MFMDIFIVAGFMQKKHKQPPLPTAPEAIGHDLGQHAFKGLSLGIIDVGDDLFGIILGDSNEKVAFAGEVIVEGTFRISSLRGPAPTPLRRRTAPSRWK
jgi:hypothetical protein